MSSLVDEPFDPFWDKSPTRREMRAAFNKLGRNDAELTGMADTAALVINYLCEKLGVNKAELDEWVEKKKAQMKAQREAMRHAEAQSELSSG